MMLLFKFINLRFILFYRILPEVSTRLIIERLHINSSLCFKLFSNCISCLIIFITATILSFRMIFSQTKKSTILLIDFCICSSNRFVIGWGTVIRTQECRNQNPMPYRLAIPQCNNTIIPHFQIKVKYTFKMW